MKNKPCRTEADIRRVIRQSTDFLTPDPLLAQRVAGQTEGRETKMKKKLSVGAVLAIALVIMTATAAVAEIIMQYNQSWYFDNRFTHFKTLEPDTYQEIMENLTDQVEQTQTENSLVDVRVQDVSFAADKNLLTFSVRVTPRDGEKYELHDMMALDTDGAYVGEGGEENPAEDSVDRAHHWLFVSVPDLSQGSKFGPPSQVMDDPEKTLVLFSEGDVNLDGRKALTSYDTFRVEGGAVILYYEIHTDQVQTEAGEYGPFAAQGDTVQVQLNYRAVEYREGMDDAVLYGGGEPGSAAFAVKLR